MGFIDVMEPGMLTTVQDLGREGWSASGVPAGGAADPLSLIVGNRLLGNPDAAPAFELTLTGGTFLFNQDAIVCVTGGEVSLAIVNAGTPVATIDAALPLRVSSGQQLRIGRIIRGCRAYLCVSGGIRVPRVLGSASTLLSGEFGGYRGRALRKGDRIEFAEAPLSAEASTPNTAAAKLLGEVLTQRTIRAVPGGQSADFDRAALKAFESAAFTVSNHSDRTGIRLGGCPISAPFAGSMISEGMPCGAVQIPADGDPIILMPDHPTTGGYPVIACTATVDLPILGQLRPGDCVRFQVISLAEARELYKARRQLLDRILPRT